MLYQLHWQWIKNGETVKTEMRAQRDINPNWDNMKTFFDETHKDHPLPKGAIWMMCTQESEYFEMTIAV
jgi:hypothetical protein